MTANEPDYERQAYIFLNGHMPEHAAVQALLGVAYELHTANLLALDHAFEGEPALKVSTQILERLGFGSGRSRDVGRDA